VGGVGVQRTMGAAGEEEEHGWGMGALAALCCCFVEVGVGSMRELRASCGYGEVWRVGYV
jgi:hypothetical protein